MSRRVLLRPGPSNTKKEKRFNTVTDACTFLHIGKSLFYGRIRSGAPINGWFIIDEGKRAAAAAAAAASATTSTASYDASTATASPGHSGSAPKQRLDYVPAVPLPQPLPQQSVIGVGTTVTAPFVYPLPQQQQQPLSAAARAAAVAAVAAHASVAHAAGMQFSSSGNSSTTPPPSMHAFSSLPARVHVPSAAAAVAIDASLLRNPQDLLLQRGAGFKGKGAHGGGARRIVLRHVTDTVAGDKIFATASDACKFLNTGKSQFYSKLRKGTITFTTRRF